MARSGELIHNFIAIALTKQIYALKLSFSFSNNKNIFIFNDIFVIEITQVL